MDSDGDPAGIVFRRVAGTVETDRAARLLVDPWARAGRSCLWYGLFDLTAADRESLAGTVVVEPVDARRMMLRGLAVAPSHRGRGLEDRLVAEIADRLRRAGVEQLLSCTGQDRQLAGVLRAAGFVAVSPGWMLLAL